MRCMAVLLILLIGFSVQAKDIVLKGEISIGDNNTDAINPRFMLTATGSNNSGLLNPRPVNPINFNLTQDIRLKKIELIDIDDVDARLYFVVWDAIGNVVINARSFLDKNGRTHADHAHAHFDNDPLKPVLMKAGDYRIAIVGQCFNKKGKPVGWKKSCSGKFNHEDFDFENIKLKTVSNTTKNNSFAFIQRRHIGDSDDSDNGYTGNKWYPDDDEGNYIQYTFKANLDADKALVNIYKYRDLLANKNHVELILAKKNRNDWEVIDSIYMNENQTSGDFNWSSNVNFESDKEYLLQINTTNRRNDLDDMSWDDVVIKLGRDEDSVNHYRILHPTSALTCDVANVTIQACSNSPRSGTCDIVSVDETVNLYVNGTLQNVVLTEGRAIVSGLNRTSPGALKLALDDATYCNANANSASCNIGFTDIGLKFSSQAYDNKDIENQTAGETINNLYLRALENDGNGTCKALEIPTPTFQLGADCINPNSCDGALPFKVGNQDLGKDDATQAISLNRVDTGVFKLNDASYGDAGQIRLHAKYTFSEDVEASGESNTFWVKPYKFTISALDKDDSTRYLNASSATSTVIYPAAKPFTLKVTAVNEQGEITQNYHPENMTHIQGRLTRVGPASDGVDGEFHYAASAKPITASLLSANWSTLVGLTQFDKGISEFTAAKYNEVGIIKLDVRDKSYHGDSNNG